MAVITQKSVETFSALVMVVVGVILTALVSNVLLRIVGSVLATLGGVLISWSASLVYTKDQAREEVKTQLETLRRQLGTVCSLISQSLTEAESGTLDDRSFLALIWQNVQSLYGVVNEIQVMTGGRFEAEDVLDTIKNLEAFAKKIANIAERPAEQTGRSEELTQLSRQLSTYVQSLKQQSRTTVTVPCPECDESVSITIGIISGESAVATCSTCGTRFHAHRRADGSVFTRKWGFYSLVKSVAITCPTCNGRLFIRTTQEQVGLMIRYCLNCFTKIQIDVGKGEIVSYQTGIVPKEGSIVGEEAGHSVLECPVCKGRIRAFIRKANDCYAVCYKCDTLVKAQYAGNMISGGVIQ
ncbi:MAG: hypothetical protein QXX19_09210 [Candidatus Caldarchaeum sp.]